MAALPVAFNAGTAGGWEVLAIRRPARGPDPDPQGAVMVGPGAGHAARHPGNALAP
jgi:hypothetical protein